MVNIELILRYIDESHECLADFLSDEVEYIFNGDRVEGKKEVLKAIRHNKHMFSVNYVTENGCTRVARILFRDNSTGFVELIVDETIERIEFFTTVNSSYRIIPLSLLSSIPNDYELGKLIRHGNCI